MIAIRHNFGHVAVSGVYPGMRSGHTFAARGKTSFEFVLVLAMVGDCIIISADMLSDAIFNQITGTADSFAEDTCGNSGHGDGVGSGSGQGGANTC